jgi:hypothetical protein
MNFFQVDKTTKLASNTRLDSLKAAYPDAKKISKNEYFRQSDDYDPEESAVQEFLNS